MFSESAGLHSLEITPSFLEGKGEKDMLQPMTVLLSEPSKPDNRSSYLSKAANHVIFVIHGIGQQTEEYGMFSRHMKSLKDTMHQVLQARRPDQDVEIELIPIEWHRHIHAETDANVHRILPKSIPTVRLIESHYLADVLYYFSKDRGQSIINHVTQMFNKAYHIFMDQHPGFDGKVAILGYSLGGLISWDILAHQRTGLEPIELNQFSKFDVQVPKLDFKPDYLFGMGCPVAGLLVARNQDPRYYHPGHDVIFENIYHPFDPLAFRLEPLLNQDFTDKPAVAIDRALPSTSFLSIFSFFSSSSTKPTEALQHRRSSILSTSVNALRQFFSLGQPSEKQQQQQEQDLLYLQQQQRRASEGDILVLKRQEEAKFRPRSNSMSLDRPPTPLLSESEDVYDDSSSCVSSTSTASSSAPCTPLESAWPTVEPMIALPGGRRYDYELAPENFMGMISNEYILGLSAHFSYWTNKDMLWHIFCRLENI